METGIDTLNQGRACALAPGPASLWDLFRTFSRLALHGFGGVLPWAQRVLVDERRWLAREEFVELLAFAQLMPGPNVCNLALMVGDRWFGWRGALVALLGMLLLPAVVVLTIALAHDRFAQIPAVQRAVSAMAAVAAGLLLATAVRLAQGRAWRWLLFGLAAFVAVALLRLPLALVLAVLGPCAVGVAYHAQRHER
jgi:chromate transporter